MIVTAGKGCKMVATGSGGLEEHMEGLRYRAICITEGSAGGFKGL